MSEPNLDSLSSQPAQPQPETTPEQSRQGPIISAAVPEPGTDHIEVPPIGPTNTLDSLITQERAPQIPARPDPLAPQPASAPAPMDPNIAAAVTNPVIETHKGTVPIPPVAGSPAAPAGRADPAGAVSNVDTPWAQRPVYLWLLLLIGVVFLFILFLVYFGGIYNAK